jgi:hypothetical protein
VAALLRIEKSEKEEYCVEVVEVEAAGTWRGDLLTFGGKREWKSRRQRDLTR